LKLLKSQRGEIMVTACVIMMVTMYVIALGMRLYPVFLKGQQLNTYASELCRVAEFSGRIGDETTKKQQKLNQVMKISPDVSWNTSGNIQQAGEIEVTCTLTENIGLFGGFGSFPFPIHGHATGQSEVYWK
jgi:hypothetical protein